MAPYLTLMREDAPQRGHDLREIFNALRWIVRAGAPWRYMLGNLPPWEAVYQQTQRWIAPGCSRRWRTTCGSCSAWPRAVNPTPPL